MQITSDIENIKVISAEIVNSIKKYKKDVHNDTLFDIKLCIEEAVRNAIVHGNKSQKDLHVDISYNIDDNKIKISVEDQGKGFHVEAVPDPTDEQNLYKESGRGVYIIHRLMENVTYNEKGNRVIMEKKLI